MKKTLAIFWREIRAVFHTPIAMLTFTFFVAIAGIYFYTQIVNFLLNSSLRAGFVAVSQMNVNDHVVSPFFENLMSLFFLTVPIVTMRSFAEERKQNTLELLTSYPLRPFEILAGKYLACLAVVLILLALTIPYPVILGRYADLDWGSILSIYVGLFLFLIFYVAVGTFTSFLSENQIIAALGCLAIILSFYFLKWLAFISSPPLSDLLAHLLLTEHLQAFGHGLVFTSYLVLYPSATWVFLMIVHERLSHHD